MSEGSPQVRLGVIGIGSMARMHLKHAAELDTVRVTALCDNDPMALDSAKQIDGLPADCPAFDTHEALLASGLCDAVLIVTPHYDHTTTGIAALKAGLHVLVEKPISVHKAACEKLIAAHTDKKQVFAAMFNQRTDPRYIELKRMIDDGELGAIVRVSWIITDWFRSEAYYRGGGWRATWAGEGGGVLLNQCPHQLDLMQWLFGMPKTVRAFCGLGIRHDIEVEDQVTAYLEYASGATGTFITTTGEAPGTNRLEAAGENGRVVIEGDTFEFIKNEQPADTFLKTSKKPFEKPKTETIHVPVSDKGGQHKKVLANFADAVLQGKPLIAPAPEGIHSVELGNAMLYSSLISKPVDLPLNGQAYEDKLQQLIAGSTHQKKVADAGERDISGSF